MEIESDVPKPAEGGVIDPAKNALPLPVLPVVADKNSPLNRSPVGKHAKSLSLGNYSFKPVMDDDKKSIVLPKTIEQTLMEYIHTEKNYVAVLSLIVHHFKEPLVELYNACARDNLLKPCLNHDAVTIFGPFDPIYKLHDEIFNSLSCLIDKNHERYAEFEGDDSLKLNYFIKILCEKVETLQSAYKNYTNFHDICKKRVKELMAENSVFFDFITKQEADPRCRREKLLEMFIRPVQRLASMNLLIDRLIKNLPPETRQYVVLNNLKVFIELSVQSINEEKRVFESRMCAFDIYKQITDCPPSIISYNRYFLTTFEALLCDEYCVPVSKKTLKAFVFDDVIELAKAASHKSLFGQNAYALKFLVTTENKETNIQTGSVSNSSSLRHKVSITKSTDNVHKTPSASNSVRSAKNTPSYFKHAPATPSANVVATSTNNTNLPFKHFLMVKYSEIYEIYKMSPRNLPQDVLAFQFNGSTNNNMKGLNLPKFIFLKIVGENAENTCQRIVHLFIDQINILSKKNKDIKNDSVENLLASDENEDANKYNTAGDYFSVVIDELPPPNCSRKNCVNTLRRKKPLKATNSIKTSKSSINADHKNSQFNNLDMSDTASVNGRFSNAGLERSASIKSKSSFFKKKRKIVVNQNNDVTEPIETQSEKSKKPAPERQRSIPSLKNFVSRFKTLSSFQNLDSPVSDKKAIKKQNLNDTDEVSVVEDERTKRKLNSIASILSNRKGSVHLSGTKKRRDNKENEKNKSDNKLNKESGSGSNIIKLCCDSHSLSLKLKESFVSTIKTKASQFSRKLKRNSLFGKSTGSDRSGLMQATSESDRKKESPNKILCNISLNRKNKIAPAKTKSSLCTDSNFDKLSIKSELQAKDLLKRSKKYRK